MSDRGLMTPKEIISQYRATPARIKEPVLLIIVNRLYRRNMTDKQLYKVTRGNWILGRRREKAEYGFSVYHGIIRAVYRILSWSPVLAKAKNGVTKIRWRFKGDEALKLGHYIGQSVAHYIKKGSQSPVLYIKC